MLFRHPIVLRHVASTSLSRRSHTLCRTISTKPSPPQPAFRPPHRSRTIPNRDNATATVSDSLPPPPPPSSSSKQPELHFGRPDRPRWARYVIALGIVFFSIEITQILYAAFKPCTEDTDISSLSEQTDVVTRYDDIANSFDSEVGISEILTGINRKRKRLAAACTGHVLEVSCGTGRNLGYYDIAGPEAKVESLTLVDVSAPMVDVCKRKWAALYGSDAKKRTLRQGLQVRFYHGSALQPMPVAPVGNGQYTTIFQTMGLCSTSSPEDLIVNMARHLNMKDPDSRIYLLEHGRSYLDAVNRVLDNSARKHAENYGCWYNRDIGALVEQAAERSGLEVVRERRYHLGTTWLFELRPKVVSLDNGAREDV